MLRKWNDERREAIIANSHEEAITYSIDSWINIAHHAIDKRGRFVVALSGGKTPFAIYQHLSEKGSSIDWNKVWLFWSDERDVPLDNDQSNYHMAMKAGLEKLPIPPSQIFPMKNHSNLSLSATEYEKQIKQASPNAPYFDLVMLGVGADGHTASLFPNTRALSEKEALVKENFIPGLDQWRLTLTFPGIENSRNLFIYALGDEKQEITKKILLQNDLSLPATKVGTKKQKAIWVLDDTSGINIL